jgi:hypothetical protein
MSSSAPTPVRVSIVVPCYNGGRFLPALFRSLDEQVFRSFDVTIVDDGSTDPETLERLAGLPAEIRVVRQPNKGLPAARNAGIAASGGPLVLPLDCDDTLEPSFLERTVAALDTAGERAQFAFTDIRVNGAHSGVVETRFAPFGQLFTNRMPYCLLMRREVFTEIGGYDEGMRQGYEDWEFNLRLLKAGAQGVHVREPLFNYFASRTGMLLNGTVKRHGQIWSAMRTLHPDLYAPASLRERARRQFPIVWPPVFLAGAGILLAARVLPYSAQNACANVYVRLKHWGRSSSSHLRRMRVRSHAV